MTEQQILKAWKHDSRGAMRALYDCYADCAWTVARRYLADDGDAEDVIQDSFLKVYDHIGRFSYRGEGSLRSWLMSIVAHEAIDLLKRRQRLVFTEQPIETGETADPQPANVPIEALLAMIRRLPAGYRAVFNLYVFEQQSHREIANALGIKESSSASQFHRARKMLAQMINEYTKTKER